MELFLLGQRKGSFSFWPCLGSEMLPARSSLATPTVHVFLWVCKVSKVWKHSFLDGRKWQKNRKLVDNNSLWAVAFWRSLSANQRILISPCYLKCCRTSSINVIREIVRRRIAGVTQASSGESAFCTAPQEKAGSVVLGKVSNWLRFSSRSAHLYTPLGSGLSVQPSPTQMPERIARS